MESPFRIAFALVRPSLKSFRNHYTVCAVMCCVCICIYIYICWCLVVHSRHTRLDWERERETGAVIIMLMTLAQPRLSLSPCHSLPDVYASAHKSNESCCKCTFIRSHTSFRKGIQFSTRNYKEEKCWHTQRETKFKTKTGKTEDKKSRIKGGKKITP